MKRLPGGALAGVLAASLVLPFSSPVFASETAEDEPSLQEQLEQMRRSQREMQERLERQQERIDELESQVSPGGGGTIPRTALASAIDEYLKSADLTSKGSSAIKFYGFARIDYIWTDSRFNNTETAFVVLPEDATVPGGFKRNSNASSLHPRLTRFGVKLDAGHVASLNGKVTGNIEVDFYNSGLAGQAQSRSAIRMRKAWGQIAWDQFALRMGQDSDLISPLYPSSNPDMVMWGAGNLGDRIPQVRGTWTSAVKDGNLSAAVMLGATGSRDGDNYDGNAYRDGETSGLPTVQARIGYDRESGDEGMWSVGVWGHRAEEDPDTKVAGKREFQSQAVGFDVKIKYGKRLTFQGEWFTGRNLDDVRGGVLQGVNTITGKEIHSMGYWGEVQYELTDTWRAHVGFTKDNPENGDVGVGGINENRVWYTGQRWDFDPVEFGIDWMVWFTNWNGVADGRAHRVQAYFAYKF